METVAENHTGVVLSTHLISDLEFVCDHLVVLVSSRVRLAGEVDQVIAHHRIVCSRREPGALPAGCEVVSAEHTDRQSTFVVRAEAPLPAGDWAAERLSMEDLVLTYMQAAESGTGSATKDAEDGR
jgi:ABC-2 type transport system ATP-binding protein